MLSVFYGALLWSSLSQSVCARVCFYVVYPSRVYVIFLMLMSMFVECWINYADWSFVCVNMWLLFRATSSPTNVGVGAYNLTTKGV